MQDIQQSFQQERLQLWVTTARTIHIYIHKHICKWEIILQSATFSLKRSDEGTLKQRVWKLQLCSAPLGLIDKGTLVLCKLQQNIGSGLKCVLVSLGAGMNKCRRRLAFLPFRVQPTPSHIYCTTSSNGNQMPPGETKQHHVKWILMWRRWCHNVRILLMLQKTRFFFPPIFQFQIHIQS